MPSLPSAGFNLEAWTTAQQAANRNLTTPDDFISIYELGMSKAFAWPLAVQTVPASPLRVQKRVSKIITRLPALALWLPVAAKLLFAVFGLVLAMMAIRATTPKVHQVHVRLTTGGLATQLFDWQNARKAVKDDLELFKENTEEKYGKTVATKGVKVRCSAPSGAEFVTVDVLGTFLENGDVLRPLQSRQTL
jgi:hypothetical protein